MGTCSSEQEQTTDTTKSKIKEQVWRVRMSGQGRKLTTSDPPSKHMSQRDQKKAMKEYFDKFDTNQDNMLSFKDVQAMLNHIYRRKDNGFPKETVQSFIEKVDCDGNGKISRRQFARFCRKL